MRFVFIIGANNALHQVMPHHIGFVEVNEGQAFHAMQNVHRFQQPAAACVGQIDLCYVAGNHALELNPRRVTNIFICSEVVFWASSRITNESFKVRPRMKAMGAISITFFSR